MMLVCSFYVFLFLYVISFFLVISGDDWFMIWMGLEINMLSFIMIIYSRVSLNSTESCLKYFFVQSVGSAILLGIFYMKSYVMSNVMIVILSYKIGAAPLYFWFPVICMSVSWLSCFMLMSFQKIIPLMLINLFSGDVMWIIMCMSLLVGVMGSFGQSNIKSLFSYSSIHHLGWIFLCNLYSDEIWMIYLMLYCFVIMNVIMLMSINEIVYFFMIDMWTGKVWFSLGMLSMGGIPPMLGFLLKWMAFMYIMNMNMIFVMIMIVMSVIMFYVYFRIIYDIFIYFNNSMCYMNYVNMMEYKGMLDMFSVVGFLLGMCMLVFMYL